jgi:hypothetical protein
VSVLLLKKIASFLAFHIHNFESLSLFQESEVLNIRTTGTQKEKKRTNNLENSYLRIDALLLSDQSFKNYNTNLCF